MKRTEGPDRMAWPSRSVEPNSNLIKVMVSPPLPDSVTAGMQPKGVISHWCKI